MDETEPPSDLKDSESSTALLSPQKENSKENLRKKTRSLDKTGLLLKPKGNELATFNCSIPQINNWPKPFLYRVEYAKSDSSPNTFFSFSKRADNKIDPFGRYSEIKLRWLKSFTEFTNDKPKTIISMKDNRQAEDPRITYIKDEDKYYITYTEFDETNAGIALATTKDFEKIKKHGIISNKIPLEKAIEIVNDQELKKIWQKRLDSRKHKKQLTMYPMDKDAYTTKNGKYKLHHRLGNSMQIAEFDEIKELQGEKGKIYWENHIKNINEHTVMRNTEPYFPKELSDFVDEKLGWGSPSFNVGDKEFVLWHGVNKAHDYCCSLLEIQNDEIISVIKDPLLKPDDTDIFHGLDGKQKRVKYATAALVDEENKQIYIYFTKGDNEIHYYATSEPWAYKELNNPNNRIKQ